MMAAHVPSKTCIRYITQQNADFKSLKHFLLPISPMYPGFDVWLNFTFRRNLASGKRQIVTAYYGSELAGVALLKSDLTERKICTFYISESFRGLGIGPKLLDIAINTLNGSDSFITVSEERNGELSPLLYSKGFRLIDTVPKLYRPDSTEYFYSL